MKTPAELAARLRKMVLAAQHHYSPTGEPLRSIVVSPEWLEDMADAANALDSNPVSQGEPAAAESRFSGCGWAKCDVAHALMVLASPDEWPGYEVRMLYTTPQPASAAPMEKPPRCGGCLRADSGGIPLRKGCELSCPDAYVTDDYGHEGVSHSISASLPVGTPLYAGKPVSVNKV